MTAAPPPGVYVGCAGWSVPKEHAAHFPAAGSHLQRYAARFPAVEVTSSFYRPHRPATYAKWAAAVPPGFRFSVKLPREVTHRRRLVGTADLLDRLLAEAGALGRSSARCWCSCRGACRSPPASPGGSLPSCGGGSPVRSSVSPGIRVGSRRPPRICYPAPGWCGWRRTRRCARGRRARRVGRPRVVSPARVAGDLLLTVFGGVPQRPGGAAEPAGASRADVVHLRQHSLRRRHGQRPGPARAAGGRLTASGSSTSPRPATRGVSPAAAGARRSRRKGGRGPGRLDPTMRRREPRPGAAGGSAGHLTHVALIAPPLASPRIRA
jgi:Protein of unknown function DUF72